MEQQIIINGRSITLRPGMRAGELKALAGIALERVLIVRGPDDKLHIARDDGPLAGPPLLDAPRFIYG